MQTITRSLPENVYRCPQSSSESAGKPTHDFAEQSNFPPLLDIIPARFRDDLSKMTKLSDDELWTMARRTADEKLQSRLRRLLRKNKLGKLTDREQEALEEALAPVDLLTLQKAYAFLLLKRRGHRIPTLAELESGSMSFDHVRADP